MKDNILQTTFSLTFGGVNTVLKGIVENWPDKNLFVFAFKKSKAEIQLNNVYVSQKNTKLILPQLFELKKFVEEHNITIIHSQDYPLLLLYSVLLKLLWFKNLKVIHHAHGPISHREIGFLQHHIMYLFLLWALNPFVDAYLGVTNAHVDDLINICKIPKNKVHVLYNYIDENYFNIKNRTDSVQSSKNLKTESTIKTKVGFAGRLLPHKGWADYLEVAKNILKTNTNIHFYVASDGPDRQKVLDFIEQNNLSSNVTYLGRVNDIRDFYSFIDIFVMPSHWETMGLTPLESQAMGTPVICSNIRCLDEVVHDNVDVIFFEPANLQDLELKLNSLLSDKPKQEMLIKNGLNNVKSFSFKDYYKKLINIYNGN